MAIVFSEGYGLPREFQHGRMGGYGDTNAWDFLQSPATLLKGIFVDKPAAEQASQVAIATQQAHAAEMIAAEKAKTTMTIVKVAGGVLGALAVGLVLLKLLKKKSTPAKVAGYRRRHRRSRR